MTYPLKNYVKLVLLCLVIACYILLNAIAYGQNCTGSIPANPSSLTGTNYTGLNITPSNGLRNWFTGGSLGGANINISANSTLIIKAGSFLTLTGATTIPIGSTVYIESGASLSIPGSLTAQGTFINLGTLTITGSNFIQLNGGAVYNDGTISAKEITITGKRSGVYARIKEVHRRKYAFELKELTSDERCL